MVKMSTIKVTPIAFESLGVRSMCTSIQTSDVKLLIDPGLALGPRFSLLPHPLEYQTRERLRNSIVEKAHQTDLVVITHYHHDHYTPNFVDTTWIGSTPEIAQEIYRDKDILVKDFRNRVNPSQRRRGWLASRLLSKCARSVKIADEQRFIFGETEIVFSAPVPHGEEGGELGWVLMVKVSSQSETVLFASDVQGPASSTTSSTIAEEKPDLLIIGGPPLYLKGLRVGEAVINRALKNLVNLSRSLQTIIVDHHLLRAAEWEAFLQPAYGTAHKVNHQIFTAQKFSNSINDIFEYRRKELYELYPPSQEFLRWTRLSKEKRRVTPPPV